MKTYIKATGNTKSYQREIFDLDTCETKLKVYIKSKLKVYDVVVAHRAVIEREEFCASKFTFTVVKDDIVSFNQGDAVSVKYDSKGIFYGYVFTKKRDKKGLIEVVCYDQMRYLKNRKTYIRGKMSLDEIVYAIGKEYSLRMGEIDNSKALLPAVAADNVSYLDVIAKACKDTKKLSGKSYILYDDCGLLMLKNEEELVRDILIDSTQIENFVYTDSIDKNVYNRVDLYTDTKRLNTREVVTASDSESMKKWGTLVLSKKATDLQRAKEEAKNLLLEYNRVNREIVLRVAMGNSTVIPGCRVYVNLTMGDIAFDGYVRVKKSVHIFERNCYVTDIYLDGSELG